MALLKAVKTEFGIDANYWNIIAIKEEFKSKVIEVLMAGYISKEIRDADVDFVSSKMITLNGEDYIADVTRATIYEKLKTIEFVNAEDC